MKYQSREMGRLKILKAVIGTGWHPDIGQARRSYHISRLIAHPPLLADGATRIPVKVVPGLRLCLIRLRTELPGLSQGKCSIQLRTSCFRLVVQGCLRLENPGRRGGPQMRQGRSILEKQSGVCEGVHRTSETTWITLPNSSLDPVKSPTYFVCDVESVLMNFTFYRLWEGA